jgi:hypothetical protein
LLSGLEVLKYLNVQWKPWLLLTGALARNKMELYGILEQFEKRPQMYFSEVCTLALESFLFGYRIGHTCPQGRSYCKTCEFEEFHDWVKCRLSSDKTGVSWRYLLLERYDDETAFRKFFEFMKEFRDRVFTLIAELSNKNLLCHQSTGQEEKEIPITSKIQLGKYTEDPGFWIRVEGPDVCKLSGFYDDLEFLENFIGVSRTDWIFVNAHKNGGLTHRWS